MFIRYVAEHLRAPNWTAAGLALGIMFASALAVAETPRIDGARLNQTMARMKTFGGNADGGSDRIAFSLHNKAALEYLAGLMVEAGLETRIDVAGNLIGSRAGADARLAPLIAGSHIDTVINGGHYDGVVGVMAAIEAARTLNDAGYRLRHPLEIVVWSNEEAGKTGSRSFAGTVQERELALTALGEATIGDGIAFLGGDPERLSENMRSPGDVAGYVELHVEQGAVLDQAGLEIGVVTGIVGIRRWNVVIEGFANHAGTTPMAQRQDALYAAAQFVTAARRVITASPGAQVGTVGRIVAEPGAPNVIPGRVTLSLEIRDLSMDKIDRLFAQIEAEAHDIAAATDTRFAIEQYYESPAAASDPRIAALVDQAAHDLGLSRRPMPSGAGHDAQSFKDIAPLGMIFIPSRDGISHAPGEYSAPDDIANGANVLLQVLIGMDGELD
ncbi:MAG: Zn-dependent hydrolase [Parvularculaceae bacterium]